MTPKVLKVYLHIYGSMPIRTLIQIKENLIFKFWDEVDRSGHRVLILTKLLIAEQSNWGWHCLLIYVHFLLLFFPQTFDADQEDLPNGSVSPDPSAAAGRGRGKKVLYIYCNLPKCS